MSQENINQENLDVVESLKEDVIPIDATFSIDVSPDKNFAYCTISKPENDGADVTYEQMLAEIKKAKIVYGINQNEIARLAKQPEYSCKIEIAKGVKAVNGEAGYISYTFDNNRTAMPKERKDGTVDYYNLDILKNVKKGELLATITHATDGTNGKNVLGEELVAVKGKIIVPPFGKNVIFSEDKLQIFAGVDGNVEVKNNQITVSEAFTVNGDVDMSTGNIDFIGNVVVTGNVLSGFHVRAGQDLIIRGMIESTSVEAGRNMTVSGGILGVPKDQITCNGDLICKFVENVTVKVKGNIKAEYITNANLICEGTLELIGSKACIIGGNYVVLKKIICNTIGSPYGSVSNIQLGSYGTIQETKNGLENKIKEIESNEVKIAQIITYLTELKRIHGSIDEDKDEMLKSAVRTKTKLLLEKSTVSKELTKLASEIEFLGKQNLECKGTLYRGSCITIKNSVFIADRDYVHTNFYFDEEKQEIVAGVL